MSNNTEVMGDTCYFHVNQGKLAFAIVNNGQFDMPACLSCLAECMKAGYTVTKTLPLFDILEQSIKEKYLEAAS